MKKTILFMALLGVFSAPSVFAQCPTGDKFVDFGPVPTNMSYVNIFLAGDGGTTATTSTTASTTLIASNQIELNIGFIAATPSAGDSVTMRIVPCVTTTQTIAKADSSLASRFATTPAGLKIYPTVSPGLVNIVGSSTDLSNAYILVTDESGRTVYKLYNSNGNTNIQLDLGMLGNGFYFLQINNGVRTTTQKIIIQK